MKITLELTVATGGLSAEDFMARVVSGLRTVNDEAEEFLVAVEAAVTPAPVRFSNAPEGVSVARAALELSLASNGWNISRVAQDLGVSRSTVRSRIAHFGLTRPGR